MSSSGCGADACGISFEWFLAAQQQYKSYKQSPSQYSVDQQVINGDISGNIEGAKARISNAMLYASYFAHRNPDVDITLEASTAILLSSITTLSGINKDPVTAFKFRGPAAKGFDWDHIFERHSDTGAVAKQRTTGTIFEGLSKSQIQAQVKAAWRDRELMETQTDLASGVSRMRYQGVDPVSGQTVEMWYNSSTRIVETAYPTR